MVSIYVDNLQASIMLYYTIIKYCDYVFLGIVQRGKIQVQVSAGANQHQRWLQER